MQGVLRSMAAGLTAIVLIAHCSPPCLANWMPSDTYLEDIVRENWICAMCDLLVENGFVTGYGKDFFDDPQELGDESYTHFTADLFNQTSDNPGQVEVSPGISLEYCRNFLFDEYHSRLRVATVELLADGSWTARSEPQILPQGIDMLTLDKLSGGSIGFRELAGIIQQAAKDFAPLKEEQPAATAFFSNAYDIVPASSQTYSILDRFARSGVLPGYPDGFVDPGAVYQRELSVYELAHAFATLLDNMQMAYPDRKVALEKAGVTAPEFVYLLVIFRVQLEEMLRATDIQND